ncbi:MAG: hypothetical protein GX617_06130 [Lentisphaerae bacterium]|nr:hypothetical protein [Lentisphaeria bacterium]NLE54495.1 hypothetical protein [Lentisphaerota bacterium]
MNYHSLPKHVKADINKEINERYPESNIDIDQIKISDVGNDRVRFEYGELTLEVPIGRPDQQTTNDIWKYLTGGVIAIVAVAVTLWAQKK